MSGAEEVQKVIRLEFDRRQQGTKQQELAAASGVSRQTISAIERGRYVPARSALVLKRLAVSLGIQPTEAEAGSLLDEVPDEAG